MDCALNRKRVGKKFRDKGKRVVINQPKETIKKPSFKQYIKRCSSSERIIDQRVSSFISYRSGPTQFNLKLRYSYAHSVEILLIISIKLYIYIYISDYETFLNKHQDRKTAILMLELVNYYFLRCVARLPCST